MSRHDLWASYLDPEDTEATPPEAERAALDRISGVLADPATWSEPPADLTARVLALAAFEEDTGAETDLAAEPGTDGTTGEPAGPGPDLRTPTGSGADPRPPGDAGGSGTDEDGPGAEPATGPDAGSRGAGPDADGDGGSRGAGPDADGDGAAGGLAPVVRLGGARRRRWLVAAGSGVAAAVAVVLAVVLWPAGEPTAYPVAGTAAEPAASAMVTVDPRPAGVAITVRISGLPPSSDDTYYAVWLRGDAGTVPVGSFHWRKSGEPIDLWSGVDPGRYPTFFITRQHEGAPPTPSAETVMQGVLRS